MATLHQSPDLGALWQETQRLNEAVAALELRLIDQAATPDNSISPDADVWNIWPYSWAINFYRFCSLRLHSFHKNLWRERSSNGGALFSLKLLKPNVGRNHDDTPRLKLV